MPTVLLEKGFKFFFFSNEGDPLEPCHIHVRKDGNLAKFWVTDKVKLADSYGFSAEELNSAEKIVSKNIVKIKKAWNEFFC
ncbi:MAG: DUF4160 domain-containing protein [Treponema sp.]|nr:DUF4160 domain-containing protein [Treponema sp.]